MTTLKLLLLSNSTQHGTKCLEYAHENIKNFFSKSDVRKILFIPYACKDYDKYMSRIKDAFQCIDIEVESIHEKADVIEAVNEARGMYVGGGNTFLLLKTLYDKQLIEPIRTKVLKGGLLYMGASAGSNVATVSICTTNDMPICHPPSLEAFGLVPFNINPHYIDAESASKHMGETRDDRIKEYHQISDIPVLGLREGCILSVNGNTATLEGISGAKLFKKDQEVLEYQSGDDVSFLLKQ